MIEADAALRGVRYPEPVESAAWYVVAEALTNVVKHAHALLCVVAISPSGGHLVVEVRDDGRGFDPPPRAGLGLAGMADRMDIVAGRAVRERPGHRHPLRAELPLHPPAGERSAPIAFRIVLADDNYLVREGTRRLLEDSGEVIVAAVGSALELLDAVRPDRPRRCSPTSGCRRPPGRARTGPGMEGIEAARVIRRRIRRLAW